MLEGPSGLDAGCVVRRRRKARWGSHSPDFNKAVKRFETSEVRRYEYEPLSEPIQFMTDHLFVNRHETVQVRRYEHEPLCPPLRPASKPAGSHRGRQLGRKRGEGGLFFWDTFADLSFFDFLELT